jgi:hypothetical protein
MMRKTVLSTCALAALTVTVSTARAETKEELRKRQKAEHHGYAIGRVGQNVVALRTEGTPNNNYSPEDCYAQIEKARADGLTDTDFLRDQQFKDYPGEAGGATKDVENNIWLLPLAKAKGICDEFAKELTLVEKVAKLTPYLGLPGRAGMSAEELSKLGSWDDPAAWDGEIAEGEKCHAAADAIIASGVAADRAVVIRHIEPFTLTAFKKDHCQAQIDWANKMKIEVPAISKERAKKVEGKFKKVGIKGKRLELFAYYDMEWYLPGCKSSTDDPKKLKKAKKLFQWLTASDGQITIRKYTFKGDNYSTSEKTTYNETQAYKLCR